MTPHEIVQYLVQISGELKEELNKLFLRDIDLGMKLKIGEDGEPTTYVDGFAEDFLIKKISSKFKCAIMSEESGFIESGDHNLLFVIDPIDGTSNAKIKLPFFSCSIGVYYNDEPVVGIVRDLYNGDIFTGIKGEGAFLNGRIIKVRRFKKISDTVITSGRPLCKEDILLYEKINFATKANRLFACPSLEICYVASGKTNWALQIHKNPCAKMMDVAGAHIILKEAGGSLFEPSGSNICLIKDVKAKFNFIACPDDDTSREEILKLVH